MTAGVAAAFALASALAILPAAPARAQSACNAPSSRVAVRLAPRHWPAPLDRPVTLEGTNVTLRDGLARLATAARVRLSYVAELLPLDRPLCLAYRRVPAGQVLADLLRGTELEPIVAGDDQVVLAPTRRTAMTPTDSGQADALRTSVLDRVVVTGSADAAPARSQPISVNVVAGEQLARQQVGSLSRILDGSVPGVWMWEQSPTTLSARYGSVRGASSFGVSSPKIYIDGIEVANPLLVTQLDPQTIERLEVIRGPQGAALYGADAISGVINIVTRHDGAGPGGQRLQLQSTAGVAGSAFAPQGVLTQQHGLTFRTGSSERSAGLGVTLGTIGAYVPGAFARTVAANGDLRIVGARSVLTGTARLFSENAGTPANPLLRSIVGAAGAPFQQRAGPADDHAAYARSASEPGRSMPGAGPMTSFPTDTAAAQSVRQYTLGGALSFTPNDRWTHAVVLGVDGYRLANAGIDDGPIPSAADSALTAAQGGTDRATMRVSSTAQFGAREHALTTLTFTGEHSVVREQSTIASTSVADAGGSTPGERASEGEAQLTGWRANSGLVAQASTALGNTLFLTAGMRLERDEALIGTTRVTSLPMLGGALVRDHGDLTLKLRAAYGKGIRPVQGAVRELVLSGRRAALVAYDLAPEEQSGVEVGADLFVGRTLGLHVTRFDQRASGLIQSVAIAAPSPYVGSSRGPRLNTESGPGAVAYQLQNVGEIANRGWEMQGSVDLGRLSLVSALSLVDSRVRRVAAAYTGDLRADDRMLDVPARTMSLTGSWNGTGWFGSLTVARAADWSGYDRLTLAEALASGAVTPRELVGERLRGYWRTYDGVTRVRASVSRDLFRGLSLVVTGDNLLGQQRGEPDNVTVVPGRTVTAGIKAKF